MRWGWLVRSLRASVTWMEAARLTAVARMPEVSQVSTGPVGGLGKMQARQAVGAGSGFRGQGSECGALAEPWALDPEPCFGRMFMVAA